MAARIPEAGSSRSCPRRRRCPLGLRPPAATTPLEATASPSFPPLRSHAKAPPSSHNPLPTHCTSHTSCLRTQLLAPAPDTRPPANRLPSLSLGLPGSEGGSLASAHSRADVGTTRAASAGNQAHSRCPGKVSGFLPSPFHLQSPCAVRRKPMSFAETLSGHTEPIYSQGPRFPWGKSSLKESH